MHTEPNSDPASATTIEDAETIPGVSPDASQNASGSWGGHPINLRFSVPFLHTRFYLAVVAGRERRPEARRHQERAAHPVATFGNALFAIGVSTLIALMGLAALIASSAILEY